MQEIIQLKILFTEIYSKTKDNDLLMQFNGLLDDFIAATDYSTMQTSQSNIVNVSGSILYSCYNSINNNKDKKSLESLISVIYKLCYNTKLICIKKQQETIPPEYPVYIKNEAVLRDTSSCAALEIYVEDSYFGTLVDICKTQKSEWKDKICKSSSDLHTAKINLDTIESENSILEFLEKLNVFQSHLLTIFQYYYNKFFEYPPYLTIIKCMEIFMDQQMQVKIRCMESLIKIRANSMLNREFPNIKPFIAFTCQKKMNKK